MTAVDTDLRDLINGIGKHLGPLVGGTTISSRRGAELGLTAVAMFTDEAPTRRRTLFDVESVYHNLLVNGMRAGTLFIRFVAIGLLGALATACASGYNYACGERTMVTSTPATGYIPQTVYTFCSCPDDKPCPELDVRNQDEPGLIIRRIENSPR
ncbi:MAG: hypothetical protein ACLFQ5_10800 [Oceanicaulis sp.]